MDNAIFHSEPVKRLFSQPNIVIRAIDSNRRNSQNLKINESTFRPVKNSLDGNFSLSNHPELSIRVVNRNSKIQNLNHFLPSKYGSGNSNVELVPIEQKLKDCGHYVTEYCEDLTCNVEVHHFEDEIGSCPLIAYDLDDDELCGPVDKHCDDSKCDALSIDHNRCRAALIRLNKCDRSSTCDICEAKFVTAEARVSHIRCKQKYVYRHNNMTPAKLFRLRMREREVQITAESKKRQSERYLDPVYGYNHTMQSLNQNKELIIIPRNVSSRPLLSYDNRSYFNGNHITFNGFRSIDYESYCPVPPMRRIKLSTDHLNGGTVNIVAKPNLNYHMQSVEPIVKVNNRVLQSKENYINLLSSEPYNSNVPHLDGLSQNFNIEESSPVPIKTVPNAKDEVADSTIHLENEILKFHTALDASKSKLPLKENAVIPPQVPELKLKKMFPKIQLRKPQNDVRNIKLRVTKAIMKKNRLKLQKQKKFACKYCLKRFSSADYCAVHMRTKHKKDSEPSIVKKVSPEKQDMPIVSQITSNISVLVKHCEICNEDLTKHERSPDNKLQLKCSECAEMFKICKSLHDHMMDKHGSIECCLCKCQVATGIFKQHLICKHNFSEDKSEKCFAEFCIVKKEVQKNVPNEKKEEVVPAKETLNEKVNADCIARSRSSRRSSRHSQNYRCAVCERTFDNETQYEIHEANNPRKVGPCPNCGKNFHRKGDLVEHVGNCTKKLIESPDEKTEKLSHLIGGFEELVKKEKEKKVHNGLKNTNFLLSILPNNGLKRRNENHESFEELNKRSKIEGEVEQENLVANNFNTTIKAQDNYHCYHGDRAVESNKKLKNSCFANSKKNMNVEIAKSKSMYKEIRQNFQKLHKQLIPSFDKRKKIQFERKLKFIKQELCNFSNTKKLKNTALLCSNKKNTYTSQNDLPNSKSIRVPEYVRKFRELKKKILTEHRNSNDPVASSPPCPNTDPQNTVQAGMQVGSKCGANGQGDIGTQNIQEPSNAISDEPKKMKTVNTEMHNKTEELKSRNKPNCVISETKTSENSKQENCVRDFYSFTNGQYENMRSSQATKVKLLKLNEESSSEAQKTNHNQWSGNICLMIHNYSNIFSTPSAAKKNFPQKANGHVTEIDKIHSYANRICTLNSNDHTEELQDFLNSEEEGINYSDIETEVICTELVGNEFKDFEVMFKSLEFQSEVVSKEFGNKNDSRCVIETEIITDRAFEDLLNRTDEFDSLSLSMIAQEQVVIDGEISNDLDVSFEEVIMKPCDDTVKISKKLKNSSFMKENISIPILCQDHDY